MAHLCPGRPRHSSGEEPQGRRRRRGAGVNRIGTMTVTDSERETIEFLEFKASPGPQRTETASQVPPAALQCARGGGGL